MSLATKAVGYLQLGGVRITLEEIINEAARLWQSEKSPSISLDIIKSAIMEDPRHILCHDEIILTSFANRANNMPVSKEVFQNALKALHVFLEGLITFLDKRGKQGILSLQEMIYNEVRNLTKANLARYEKESEDLNGKNLLELEFLCRHWLLDNEPLKWLKGSVRCDEIDSHRKALVRKKAENQFHDDQFSEGAIIEFDISDCIEKISRSDDANIKVFKFHFLHGQSYELTMKEFGISSYANAKVMVSRGKESAKKLSMK